MSDGGRGERPATAINIQQGPGETGELADRRTGEVRAPRCIVGRRHVEIVSPVRACCLGPDLGHTYRQRGGRHLERGLQGLAGLHG